MRRYQAPLSLTSLVCFMGTLQSIAVTFVMEHKPNVWTIGWDMNLLAAAYAVSLSLSLYIYLFLALHIYYFHISRILVRQIIYILISY